MTATNYSPLKFLWATTAFVLFLFIFIGLVLVYLQKPNSQNAEDNSPTPVSALVPTSSSEAQLSPNSYQSSYGWKVTYPDGATIDKSVESGSTSLDRLTISELDKTQPAKEKGFYGYSVDFSTENLTGVLSTFADRDSLQIASGKRVYFTGSTINGRSGYKALIRDTQEYISYYLPLKDKTKVLIVTTSTNGSNKENWDKTVSQILEQLELLD